MGGNQGPPILETTHKKVDFIGQHGVKNPIAVGDHGGHPPEGVGVPDGAGGQHVVPPAPRFKKGGVGEDWGRGIPIFRRNEVEAQHVPVDPLALLTGPHEPVVLRTGLLKKGDFFFVKSTFFIHGADKFLEGGGAASKSLGAPVEKLPGGGRLVGGGQFPVGPVVGQLEAHLHHGVGVHFALFHAIFAEILEDFEADGEIVIVSYGLADCPFDGPSEGRVQRELDSSGRDEVGPDGLFSKSFDVNCVQQPALEIGDEDEHHGIVRGVLNKKKMRKK